MEEIKIEKNVQIPIGDGRSKYPFNEMDVGDSFSAGEYTTKLVNSVRASFHYYEIKSKEDKKFFARKCDGQVRCWRIE